MFKTLNILILLRIIPIHKVQVFYFIVLKHYISLKYSRMFGPIVAGTNFISYTFKSYGSELKLVR